MTHGYSEDLRLKVVEAYQAGEGSYETLAQRFKIGVMSVYRYMKRLKEFGHVRASTTKRGRKPALDESGLKKIRQIVEAKPDITLAEIGKLYNRKRKKPIGRAIIHRALIKLGFKRKKKSYYAANQDEEAIKKSAPRLSNEGAIT